MELDPGKYVFAFSTDTNFNFMSLYTECAKKPEYSVFWGNTPSDLSDGERNVQEKTIKTTQTIDGLSEIQYTLPSGWTAEIRTEMNDLFLSSDGDSGFLAIRAYEYNNTGRRETYCRITNFCIDSTQFTPTTIGNISGYKATSLDNSGGGSEFFGVKGNRFYIVSTFSFGTKAQQALDSLIF